MQKQLEFRFLGKKLNSRSTVLMQSAKCHDLSSLQNIKDKA